VLTAAQLNDITNLPINDQTASYTLVVGDAGKRVIMNNAGATTITVPNSVFTTGDTIFIANKGAGTCTVTAGAGTTVNVNGSLALTQYGGGTLVALSASTFTFFPGSVKNTLSVEFLLVGGGGGGSRGAGTLPGAGGGGGGFVTGSGIIGKTTYTVKVGAAGAGSTSTQVGGRNGTASAFINSANGGGGAGNTVGDVGVAGQIGGSGGGGTRDQAGGAGISGEGNNGGAGSGDFTNGGGGGGAGGAGTSGGTGGAASTNDYTGTSISYSGGGGGGPSGTAGTDAGAGGSPGGAATANRGGGGGGGAASQNGGNGGSGRVVVRWLTADAAGLSISVTGTTTNGTDGSYTWYAWDSTGTLVVA
jgi:hypothetical protein